MALAWLWEQKDSDSLSCAWEKHQTQTGVKGWVGGRPGTVSCCLTQPRLCPAFSVCTLMSIGLNAQGSPKGSDLYLSNVLWGERAPSSLVGPGSRRLYSSDSLVSAAPPQLLHQANIISRGQTNSITPSIRMKTPRRAATTWPRDIQVFLPFHESSHQLSKTRDRSILPS